MRVFYHANCADGFTSAWVLHHSYKGAGMYVPVSYGKEMPPTDENEIVYIVDFSFPPDVLNRLSNTFVVIDHHQLIEGYRKEIEYVYDVNKSGAMLCWEYANSDEESPPLVRYVQDRDLWRWELYKSREINAVIGSHTFDFGVWDYLDARIRYSIDDVIREGVGILRAQTNYIDRAMRGMRKIEWEGYKCGIVNSCLFQSEIGEKIGEEIGIVWYDDVVSLRSRVVDVSVIARKYGGGGHKAAAGFKGKTDAGL